MITTTKALEERTQELFALIDGFGADVDLKNAVTGECIKPDTSAMFAGMQAGLVMASWLADMKKKPTGQELYASMLSGIECAAKLFVRRTEREWDKMAEECAKDIAEGRDDA